MPAFYVKIFYLLFILEWCSRWWTLSTWGYVFFLFCRLVLLVVVLLACLPRVEAKGGTAFGGRGSGFGLGYHGSAFGGMPLCINAWWLRTMGKRQNIAPKHNIIFTSLCKSQKVAVANETAYSHVAGFACYLCIVHWSVSSRGMPRHEPQKWWWSPPPPHWTDLLHCTCIWYVYLGLGSDESFLCLLLVFCGFRQFGQPKFFTYSIHTYIHTYSFVSGGNCRSPML